MATAVLYDMAYAESTRTFAESKQARLRATRTISRNFALDALYDFAYPLAAKCLSTAASQRRLSMSLPCAPTVADDARPPRGPLLQLADSAAEADAWTGLGQAGAQRGSHAGQNSTVVAFTLPRYTVATRTLWIKEVGCRSLLRVASIPTRFGRTVRALRAKAGYSQESFADATHIHRTSMGTLERGEGNPRLDTILKIARGLDMSLSELFVAMEKDTG